MRLPELAALYLLVGIGAAAAFLALRRPVTATTLVDAALLGPFWPLYGPFLALKSLGDGQDSEERLATTFDQEQLPLSSLLPDQETADALDRRVSLARARIVEIDELLRRPELSEPEAQRRLQQLERQEGDGAARALAVTRRRIRDIRHLQQMRAGFADELLELGELVAQLRVQAEVVRLVGEEESDSTRELLDELHLRLETLDEMLGIQAPELAVDQEEATPSPTTSTP
jgi:hypothetical protein